MELKLIYVDTPFWRAEVPRIALHHASIPFQDKRIRREDFLEARQTGFTNDGDFLPFKQIPVLVINGVSLSQTGAISRFCGKLSGLYPIDDDLLAAKIDQVIDMATDITVLFSNYRKISETDIILKNRQVFFDKFITNKLTLLESLLLSEKALSNTTTLFISDIAVWRVLGWLSSGIIDGFPTDFIHKLPTLQKTCIKVEETASIIEWVKKTYPKYYVHGNYR